MNSFYEQPRLVQWALAILFAGVAFALMAFAAFGIAEAVGLRMDSPLQVGMALVVAVGIFLPFWLLVCAFFFAPLLRLSGVLRYYSPYLIVTRADRGRLCLHGALPFDYLWLFCWQQRGRPAVRRILLWYVDGLIALAREVETGQIHPGTEISGTSYILNGNSLRRLGFKIENAPGAAVGGVLTFPTQFLTYSFARGRWSLPPIHRTKKATISAAELRSRLGPLLDLRERLCSAVDRHH